MSTEIQHYSPEPISLSEQMTYAQTVTDSSILPKDYRNNPANALIAIGLGQAMGLSPAESLYRIDVIQGKPTASAELIASNVRKAGHKLRVRGDEQSCTATIVRADDPDFPFEVTRDVNWARNMGLLNKDNYKKQPGTMLQWRAVTAVARLACPEALYGVAYTADEMYDVRPAPATQEPAQPQQEPVTIRRKAPEPAPEITIEEVPQEDPRTAAYARLTAAFEAAGIPQEDRRRESADWVHSEWDKTINSPADLSVDEIHELASYFESLTAK